MDKLLSEMTDTELQGDIREWEQRVAGAAGFPSAYYAARQLEKGIAEANRRGISVSNKFPIKRG